MINVPDRRSGVKRLVFPSPAVPLTAAALVAAAFLGLSACDDDRVTGQVVAVVNGEEITIPELNQEARVRGVVIGNDPGLRNAIVADLVERKLLAQAAVERKVDRTPEHLLIRRRATEMLLAEELLGSVSRQRGEPSADELARFMRANPQAFAERRFLTVDRIAIPTTLAPALARALAESPSLDAAQALLAGKAVAAERRSEVWDSATLSREIAARLFRREAGKSVFMQFPGRTMLIRVTGMNPQPTPAADRTQLARGLMQAQRGQEDRRLLLQQTRATAEIRYQPTFAPR